MAKKANTRKPAAPSLFRAQTETRHFTWEAYGTTADAARDLLARTLREHTEFSRDEVATFVDEAHVYEVRAGVGMRDSDIVTEARA